MSVHTRAEAITRSFDKNNRRRTKKLLNNRREFCNLNKLSRWQKPQIEGTRKRVCMIPKRLVISAEKIARRQFNKYTDRKRRLLQNMKAREQLIMETDGDGTEDSGDSGDDQQYEEYQQDAVRKRHLFYFDSFDEDLENELFDAFIEEQLSFYDTLEKTYADERRLRDLRSVDEEDDEFSF